MPDPIKRTTAYNPVTGETTYKASWSGSENKMSRGPITPKPTQRTVYARQVNKTAYTKTPTSGERTLVTFKSPTPAPSTNKAEIKSTPVPANAAKVPLTKREIIGIKVKKDEETLKKEYPKMTIEEARAKRYKEITKTSEKANKENRKYRSVGPGDTSSKQKGTSCKTC